MHHRHILAVLLLSAPIGLVSSLVKRDSWGPALSLGPSKSPIIQTTTTIYPGPPPSNQTGYLFSWLGISNGTGDLIQSIIGSYPHGTSECPGAHADATWCVSSEVYGDDVKGLPNQWVGDVRSALLNFTNGVRLEYTLVDKKKFLWVQSMKDAVTGQLLSTFNKTSGPMLGWGTALECDNYNGKVCKGTTSEQWYVNSTIILDSADAMFIQTLGASSGANHTAMETADKGKTWIIAKIYIPAMQR
ncbi:hypothetical protein N431DRAFT_504839 [Stipitochalara longipes BDJ]|nr:hypothetical protein N431DRAFT_504839 [Stipitochalara longipes BDJ]